MKILIYSSLLLVLFVRPPMAFAAENANVDLSIPPRFEDAQAWNVVIERRIELEYVKGQEALSTFPVFSHDFKRVIYCIHKRWLPGYPRVLEIRSLDDWNIIKSIGLPAEVNLLAACAALSPDEKKVAIFDGRLFIVNLETSVVTPVSVECLKDVLPLHSYEYGRLEEPLTWAEADYITSGSGKLNLETLECSTRASTSRTNAREHLQISRHENCELKIEGAGIVMTSRNQPFSKFLEPAAGSDEISWSPDLKYIIYRNRPMGLPGTPVIIKLGLRPTPTLDFEIKHIQQGLSEVQWQQIGRAFKEGKRIWANVYDPRVNPLNGRVLGPDERTIKGQGFLSQIEPTLKFKFSYEEFPVTVSNVVASFRVSKQWSWSNSVWGELVKAGEGEKSNLDAVLRQENPEQLANGKNAVSQPQADLRATAYPALFPMVMANRWGFIDKKAKVIINPQFDEAGPFSEGLAAIGVQGLFGYINSDGKFVINPQFAAAGRFVEGCAVVKLRGLYGYIDKTGSIIINPQFDEGADFAEGLAAVKLRRQFGFIDKTGNIVIKTQFEKVGSFSGGLAAIKIGGQWGYIDKIGKIAINPQFDEAGAFVNGLAPVRIGKNWGYIDASAKMVINPQFQGADAFSEGLARVRKVDDWGGRWGFIDNTGKFAISPRWVEAESFANGLARVKIQGGIAYIDATGKEVWHPTN